MNTILFRLSISDAASLEAVIDTTLNWYALYRDEIIGNYRVMYELVNEKRIDIFAVHHGAKHFKTI